MPSFTAPPFPEAHTSAPPWLTLQNIRVQRGGRCVLDDLSLTLSAGEALLVEGPNGVGKSTFLRMVAGLCPLDQGTRHCRGTIGWLGHLDGLRAGLSVADNLRLFLKLGGHAPAALSRALAEVGLAGFEDRPARLLSAGQKRRAGLAGLLLKKAPLWLLDEPATGLDSASLAQLGALIERHLQQGGAAIVTTHVPLPLPNHRNLKLSPAAAQVTDIQSPSLSAASHNSWEDWT